MKKTKSKEEISLDRKIFLLKISFNVCVILGIGICFILSNKIIEGFFLLISYLFLRYCFPKTYHCQTILGCLFWSIMIFIIAEPFVLPRYLSLLSSVVIGYLMTFILYKVQCYFDYKDFYNKHNEFKLETATNEQIEYLCKLLNYKENKIELAKMFFVDKKTNEQVFKYMIDIKQNVDLDTIRQYRYRILKDFKKILEK